MNTTSLLNLKIRPVTALWLFMFLSFLTSPFNPNPKYYGFNSVEFSFFALIFVFAFIAFLVFLKQGRAKLITDSVLYYCSIFMVLQILSVIDTQAKLRGILFAGQYLPYFFLMYLAIAIVNTQMKLEEILNKLILLTIIFNVILCSAAIYFNSRSMLDAFMKDYFQIELMKVLVFIELPFAILAYRIMNSKVNKLEIIAFVTSLISTMLSGSRGCFLIMAGIIYLAIYKERFTMGKIWKSIVIVITLLIATLSTGYVQERLDLLFVTSESEYQDKIVSFSRVYTMQMAFKMMKDNPINGVGTGNMSNYTGRAFLDMKPQLPSEIIEYWRKNVIYETTTSPLKYGAELGVGGFLFFFVFYYYLWMRSRRGVKIAGTNMRGNLQGMEIFIVGSFFHNIIDLTITNYYTWFYYGLAIAACRIVQENKIKIRRVYGNEKDNYNRTGWRDVGNINAPNPSR